MAQLLNSPALQAALQQSYTFALGKGISYIDSDIILAGILATSNDLFSEVDKTALTAWLNNREWPKGKRIKDANLPLTLSAEHMMRNAFWYALKLDDKQILPEHVILSILSIDNQLNYKLRMLGIIFETFAEQLQPKREQPTRLTIHYLHLKPPHSKPYIALRLFFHTQKKRAALADKHCTQAAMFLQYHDFVQCRTLCNYALQLVPGHYHAQRLQALSWVKEKNYPEAISCYQRIYEVKNGGIKILPELANCYFQTGNYVRAEELYKEALMQEAPSAAVLNNIGFLYIKMQKYETAIDYCDQAIAAEPAQGYAYSNKGNALMQLGNLMQARELLLRSLQLDKGNPYTYRNLAHLDLKENNTLAAKEMLRTAQRYQFTRMYGPEVDDLLRELDTQ